MLGDGLYRFTTVKPGVSAAGAVLHINIIVNMRGLLMHAFTPRLLRWRWPQ